MLRYYIAAIFLLATGLPARAQTRDTLEQVVVTPGHLRKKRTDAPLAITQLTARDLKEAHAASLDQVLNKVNGVFMVKLGNEQHSMSIRQPLSYKSLFLYLEDGIPIRPAGVFNHNALIEMNMAALRNIEVVKGPASAIYGSEAIGGSVNFLSESASALPEAYFSLQGDNLGYRRMDLKAGNTFTKGRHGLQLNGYYAYRRHGLQQHSDFDKLAVTLRSDYAFSSRSKLTSTATLVNYRTDMTGAIDSGQFYSRNYPSQHTFTYREVKALRLRSSFDRKWSDNDQSRFTLLFRDNLVGQNPSYRVKNDRGDPLHASGEINENTFQSYGGIFQHTKHINFWQSRVTAGFSIDHSPVRYQAEYIAVRRNEEGMYTGYESPDSLLTDYWVGLTNTALYTQWEASPLDRLKIVAAIRYDHFLYDYTNSLPPGAFSGAPDSRNIFRNISPKLGLTFDLGRGRAMYLNFSTGFVPPQVTELYRGVKVAVLEPSVYSNYEAGGWFGFPGGGAEISLYRLEGSNEIISVLSADGTTENRNVGKTLHQGIEYSLRYAFSDQVKIRVGGAGAEHSYLSYSEGSNNYDGKEMAAAPAWLANTEVSYYPSFLKNAHIALEWQHMGSYYLDPANTEKYPGFDIMNLRIGGTIGGIEAWINVLNLMDTLYATHSAKSAFGKRYSAGEPRTFSIGVGYHIKKTNRNSN